MVTVENKPVKTKAGVAVGTASGIVCC